jgi:hypothetical protein
MSRYDILKNRKVARKPTSGSLYRLKNGIIVQEMWRNIDSRTETSEDVIVMTVKSIPISYRSRPKDIEDGEQDWYRGKSVVYRGNKCNEGSEYDIEEKL